ncbi:DUF6118 family protein [Novosphingobium cyanobacteriorum]|uniref:DUF6118 family protein n=1 Tax=Novosphingobium cyanobacteriorum TaxID=3024215 RepID=A0ABT6CK73_9SPHN|nr:DUF6118 family protein [Novosphingobium cyanobacteriorum]MDF8334329.1 DUF6118 family protein [Novosphingobium cyanobacteriorum]
MQDTDDVDLDLEPEDEPEPGVRSSAPVDGRADPATQAFVRLERQMALMRHAVEHLSTERVEMAAPDYSATLGKLAGDLAKVTQAVAQIAAEPALKHTPLTMAERIAQAAEAARRSDHDRLIQAQSELRAAGEDLRRTVGTVRTAAVQRQQTVKAVGIGVLTGVVLWVGLAGPIARSLPDNWQLPERMAKRALGAPTLVDAGAKLLQSADPARWEEVVQAATLSFDNRNAIDRCRLQAQKAKSPTNCIVRVGP